MRGCVLLVDDEQDILDSLQRLLLKEDYQVLCASSGQEGLELMREHTVDVIISDYRMPRMNGADFLHLVQREYPHTVRMILSAFSDSQVLIDSINRGKISRYIEKPWDNEQLKDIIRQALMTSQKLKQQASMSSLVQEITDYIIITDEHGKVVMTSPKSKNASLLPDLEPGDSVNICFSHMFKKVTFNDFTQSVDMDHAQEHLVEFHQPDVTPADFWLIVKTIAAPDNQPHYLYLFISASEQQHKPNKINYSTIIEDIEHKYLRKELPELANDESVWDWIRSTR